MNNHEYRAKVVRVIDGDSVILKTSLGFHIETEINARLLNVDTPERGAPDFDRATNLLSTLLSAKADEDGWIQIRTEKTGKFGRWLVDIEGVNSTLAETWPYER
jgi:micrococcal nuclease